MCIGHCPSPPVALDGLCPFPDDRQLSAPPAAFRQQLWAVAAPVYPDAHSGGRERSVHARPGCHSDGEYVRERLRSIGSVSLMSIIGSPNGVLALLLCTSGPCTGIHLFSALVLFHPSSRRLCAMLLPTALTEAYTLFRNICRLITCISWRSELLRIKISRPNVATS